MRTSIPLHSNNNIDTHLQHMQTKTIRQEQKPYHWNGTELWIAGIAGDRNFQQGILGKVDAKDGITRFNIGGRRNIGREGMHFIETGQVSLLILYYHTKGRISVASSGSG